MESVLIISGGKSAQTISSLIAESFPEWQQSAALTAREARQLLSQRAFDMVVINCPPQDCGTYELLTWFSECSDAGILLLAPPDEAAELTAKASALGAAVVKKQPLGKAAFAYSLTLISSLRKRLLGMGTASDRTEAELKSIGRAKAALMHYLKFTEQQAHRYLEKQAMDLRIPMSEAAMRVIKMYEQ